MSIRRFSTASISTGNSKSTKLWDQETFQSGMFALATISLTSTASTVTFSDIPSIYTHLQIRAIARNNTADNGGQSMTMYFNNDTTHTNYRSHLMYGVGSGSGTSESAQLSGYYGSIGFVPAANMTANVYSGQIIDVLDYASTSKTKVSRTLWGLDSNSASGYCGLASFLWNSTNAVTSISFSSFPSASFVAGSNFALYGIKAA